jgi:hypothetical protein
MRLSDINRKSQFQGFLSMDVESNDACFPFKKVVASF